MTEQASEEIVIQAPPDAIMEVITDFGSYPEWAENIRSVEVRERDEEGRATHVWYHVDARVMDVEYVLAYDYPSETRLTWQLAEGEQIKQLEGAYDLAEEDHGTRVRYSLEVDVAFPVPGFLKKRAAKVIMETGLGELKRRVEG